MIKKLKLFQTDSEYTAFTGTTAFVKPNVSHCVQEDHVHYNPYTFADEYFTIESLEDNNTIYLKASNTAITKIVSASTDNGETWTEYTSSTGSSGTTLARLNTGDKLLVKGENNAYGTSGRYNQFKTTKRFEVNGNIMSLVSGDSFVNADELTVSYTFNKLFYQCTRLTSAEKLVLPATRLADSCFYNMFQGCTSLTIAPNLPVTTLALSCYSGMFSGCTSLTTAPKLPATTLANYCYQDMFNQCTSLATAPKLPATTLANRCYYRMFYQTNVLPDTSNIDFTSEQVVASGGLKGLFAGTNVTDNDLMRILPKNSNGKYCLPVTTLADNCYEYMFNSCTSLTIAPELPATTLTERCYDSMFKGCTNLTTAPELPATTLANSCYVGMFYGCTRLTVAPELHATTLVSGCYSNMFDGCTSLTTAPELIATTLTMTCYYSMFHGCSSLNSITCLATNISADNCTNNWLGLVASSGTFTKAASMNDWETGSSSGIPDGWTVVDAS